MKAPEHVPPRRVPSQHRIVIAVERPGKATRYKPLCGLCRAGPGRGRYTYGDPGEAWHWFDHSHLNCPSITPTKGEKQ